MSWLKTPIDLKLKCKQFDDTHNWKKLQPKFHCNSQSNSKFRDALNLSVCSKKISDFLAENFDNSLNGVEEANRTFTDILINAAKPHSNRKEHSVKTQKSKKWFNRECKESRKKFTTLSNLKNKNQCDPVLRQTCAETLKGYKNVCDENRKQFWGSRINDLYNVSSDTNLWNVWKGCNDTVEDKSPAFKNGKLWYQNLFTKAPKRSVIYDMSVNTHQKLVKSNQVL